MSKAIALAWPGPTALVGANLLSSSSAITQRGRWQDYDKQSRSALDWVPPVSASFEDIRTNFSEENWAGENERAITEPVINLAEKIVWALHETLPLDMPSPDVIPESDGEICLSWTLSENRVFSLSIGSSGKINYSGQLGRKGVVHGWQPIDSSSHWSIQAGLREIAGFIVQLFEKDC